MKTALGMVIKEFLSADGLLEFLENAARYGHQIDKVIVVYTSRLNAKAAELLRSRAREVSFIRLHHYDRGEAALRAMGLSEISIRTLLFCPLLKSHGLVPYGFNRNTVLIEALLSEIDVLFFVDSDVHPTVLLRNPDTGEIEQEPVDFFGSHMRGLRDGADITTSDYSGYNILPPARFDGMRDLLLGLRKENMYGFWRDSQKHNCMMAREKHTVPKFHPTSKLLGGNMAIRIASLSKLPPFFSPYYFRGETPYLARGEDTLLGLTAGGANLRFTDVDTPIFHDTYGTYPAVPDLRRDPAVQERLFYACTGWLGRNSFLQWKIKKPSDQERIARAEQLKTGADALAEYTGNDLFKTLPQISGAAEAFQDEMGRQYTATIDAWSELIRRGYAW